MSWWCRGWRGGGLRLQAAQRHVRAAVVPVALAEFVQLLPQGLALQTGAGFVAVQKAAFQQGEVHFFHIVIVPWHILPGDPVPLRTRRLSLEDTSLWCPGPAAPGGPAFVCGIFVICLIFRAWRGSRRRRSLLGIGACLVQRIVDKEIPVLIHPQRQAAADEIVKHVSEGNHGVG